MGEWIVKEAMKYFNSWQVYPSPFGAKFSKRNSLS